MQLGILEAREHVREGEGRRIAKLSPLMMPLVRHTHITFRIGHCHTI